MQTRFKNLYDFNLAKSGQIQALTEPLNECFDIHLQSYRRFYKNGNLLYLLNHQKWMDYSFEQGWIHSETFSKRLPSLFSKGFYNYIWPSTPPPDDSIYGALHAMKIHNGIAMYKDQDDYVEVFVFSNGYSSDSSQAFYLNNLFILDRFILYFRNKVHSLAKDMDKACFLQHSIFKNVQLSSEASLNQYYEKTKYRHFYMHIKGREYKLSQRETECLGLLAQGKSIKGAACLLKISPRTVITHIDNIKLKTDIPSTDKLIDSFLRERQKYQVSCLS